MKVWKFVKDVMLTLAITMLYAIWSKEGLHEVSTIHMWAILILVAILIYHLISFVNQEVRKLEKERRKKKQKIKAISFTVDTTKEPEIVDLDIPEQERGE